MKPSGALLVLALVVAAAGHDARPQSMPDNSTVTLDPDDTPDLAYRETLDGHERLRLEEAELEGDTFLPYFYGSTRPPVSSGTGLPAPRKETESAVAEPGDEVPIRSPRRIVTTYESHGIGVAEAGAPAGLVEALIEEWNLAPRIVTLAYPPDAGESEAETVSRPRDWPQGVKPGSAFYGRILYTIRSDAPGPVVIELLEPPLAGAIATGTFEQVGERLVLYIARLEHEGRRLAVDGWGVGLDCACFAVQGAVDRHWFERVLLPAAFAFAERWLVASSAPQTTVSINGDVVIEETESEGTRTALYQGLGGAAEAVSGILRENAPGEATVWLARNTEIAVVLLGPAGTGRFTLGDN